MAASLVFGTIQTGSDFARRHASRRGWLRVMPPDPPIAGAGADPGVVFDGTVG